MAYIDTMNVKGTTYDIRDNGAEGAIAILATGNTHAAIASGQFVYVKGHSSLAEGLYQATAAINANGALSTSNLSAKSGGAANALKSQIDTVNSNLASTKIIYYTVSSAIPDTSRIEIDFRSAVPSGYSVWSVNVTMKSGDKIYCLPNVALTTGKITYVYDLTADGVMHIENQASGWGNCFVYITAFLKKN